MIFIKVEIFVGYKCPEKQITTEGIPCEIQKSWIQNHAPTLGTYYVVITRIYTPIPSIR